ncbi:MAG: coiled-coil domain-containing protein [Promethearchaeota archaeon]|jgi:hypothetical protein
MKLYKIIQEQEEEETPVVVRKITPVHKRMLNALSRMEIDSTDYRTIWNEVWNVFKINDEKLAGEITYLFHEFDYVFDEYEKDSYQDLPDDALSELNDMSNYSDSQIALAKNLELPPFLISDNTYGHYDLTQYYDITTNYVYAVGDSDEVESSMKEWAQEYYDSEGIEYIDRYYLDDYIEINDISDFVEGEVDNILDDMTEDGIIEEAGYDKDGMVDYRDSMVSDANDIKDEMEDIESEKDELQQELDDMRDEDEIDEDEIDEITQQINDLEVQYEEKDDDVDDLNEQISDLEDEIDELGEKSKDELRDQKISDLTGQIEDEGVDYFIDNLGYDLSQAIDYFCYFDEEGFVANLAESEDNERLANYDNLEDYEEVNGETYYIYRTE